MYEHFASDSKGRSGGLSTAEALGCGWPGVVWRPGSRQISFLRVRESSRLVWVCCERAVAKLCDVSAWAEVNRWTDTAQRYPRRCGGVLARSDRMETWIVIVLLNLRSDCR